MVGVVLLLLTLTLVSFGQLSSGAELTKDDAFQALPIWRGLGKRRGETVLSSGKILAVETREPGHSGGQSGQVYVRQMTNGKEFLFLIYKGHGSLVACERGDTLQLEHFMDRYFNDTPAAFHLGDHRHGWSENPETMENLENKELLDWEGSKEACARLQEGKRQRARKLPPSEVDKVMERSRSRRALSLIVPDTTWCGVGNVSKGNDLTDGAHWETDRCCQRHDLCDYTIEGFTRKYNFLNLRFHTISHCDCDDKFRTCLRMINDQKADFVGRVFFNILAMKCFTLKPETTCLERAWWGRCTRYGRTYSAVLSESVRYHDV